jgi:hypothetical protein
LDTKTFLICLGVGIYLLIGEGFFKIGYKIFAGRRYSWLLRLIGEDTYGFANKMVGILFIIFVVFAYLEHVVN